MSDTNTDLLPIREGSDVLNWIVERLKTIRTGPFPDGMSHSLERIAIEEETSVSINGKFSVDADTHAHQGMHTANGIQEHQIEVAVRVGFYLGGGEGVSDRVTVNGRALDAMLRLAGALEDSDYYEEMIENIEYRGSQRSERQPQAEIWTARFLVKWASGTVRS